MRRKAKGTKRKNNTSDYNTTTIDIDHPETLVDLVQGRLFDLNFESKY
jgi:hypothetical protein